MTNKKTTKRALLSSLMALLLCVSMFVGTTFAWFTDSVTSANNVITAGNLDIALDYWDGDSWETIEGTDSLFTDNLWEPGHTEVVYLKLSNLGSLALKYQLAISVLSETEGTNVAGDPFKLSDYIWMGVVEGVNGETNAYDDREAAVDAVKANSGIIGAGYAKQGNMLADAAELYMAVVVYMPETVGNEANAKTGTPAPTINLGVQVLATQYTAEGDSFDDQYDKGAWHPDFTVTSVEDLATALANGGKIQVNGTLNAGATQDVPNWTNAPAEFIFDATTLDALKGGKYVLEQGSRYGVVGLISAGESLALSDMEITANSQWPVYLSNYGGTLTLEDIDVTATQGAGIYPYGTNGTTTIKSATVNQKALSDEFASSTPWAGTAIATSNGHNLIIEDGTYIGSTWGVYVYNSGANVTINGGTFKAPTVIRADGVWSTGGNKSVVTVNDGNFDGALYLDWGTTPPEIYINGGNFTNFSATVNGSAKLVIKGGTFDADPSAYVADGYSAVNNNGTYTVLKGEVYVKNSEELATAINEGKQEIALAAGTFTLPNANNKNVTLIGVGTETIVDYSHMGGYQEVSGSSFSFKNMTVVNVEAGYPYKGLQHITSVAYENCHILGTVNLFAPATFTNCTFDSKSAEHNVVTYASDSVTFTDCTFAYGDRAVNCYAEDASSRNVEVTFTNCNFTKVAGKDASGAIETNSSLMNSLTLTIDNCTVNEGELWFIAGWDSLSGAKTTVTVNGSTDKGVVLVQSGVLPYLTLNSNATYMLVGDFGGQNVSLVMPVGVENVIFDGSKATNINELIITQNGALIDNATTPIGVRSGNVTVQNFNVLSQINVFACKTEVVVQNNTAEALMIHAGNCDVKVLNNTIDANFESHPTYQNATQIWNTNNYGIALNIFDYNLWLDGNTVTDATGHAIGINGWETTIDNGDENVIESFKGNTITVNSTTNKRAAFKVWDDETYASNDEDTNVVNATAQAFIDAVLADGSNTFNIVEGYNHTIFSFYNVNTNN